MSSGSGNGQIVHHLAIQEQKIKVKTNKQTNKRTTIPVHEIESESLSSFLRLHWYHW